MAKSSDTRPGKDRPYYETSSGIVFAPSQFANGITGTPSFPGMRGGPDAPGSGTLDGGKPRVGNNGVIGKFFSKSGG